MFGVTTIVTVGGFVLVGTTAQMIFIHKKRNDLAKLLDTLMKLALIGFVAYVLWSTLLVMLNAMGGFPYL